MCISKYLYIICLSGLNKEDKESRQLSLSINWQVTPLSFDGSTLTSHCVDADLTLQTILLGVGRSKEYWGGETSWPAFPSTPSQSPSVHEKIMEKETEGTSNSLGSCILPFKAETRWSKVD